MKQKFRFEKKEDDLSFSNSRFAGEDDNIEEPLDEIDNELLDTKESADIIEE